MKVLFVCNGNAARSQIAEALFNDRSSHQAVSAGTAVSQLNVEGQTLGDHAADPKAPETPRYVLKLMGDDGLDLSSSVRNQVTRQMVDDADVIVAMRGRVPWPDFLADSEKLVFWDTPDPVHEPMETVQRIKDDLTQRVDALIKEIG